MRRGTLVALISNLMPFALASAGASHTDTSQPRATKRKVRFRSDGLLHVGIAKARRRGRLKGKKR